MYRASKMAGDWWAEKLNEKYTHLRKGFSKAIATRVDAKLKEGSKLVLLTCDYDPWDILLDALHDVGISCSGDFFSAKGILPNKHELIVSITFLEPKEGYGNWTPRIEVENSGVTCVHFQGRYTNCNNILENKECPRYCSRYLYNLE